jgi:hypothetical protein
MATDPWAGFERDLALITAEADPEVIKRDFVAFAKQSLADVIASGEASTIYDRYVNGRPNLPEEAVELPGLIVYEFVNWPLVINAVLAELESRSPRKSGRFASSFIVIVGEKVVTDFKSIPNGAEVRITNAQPYVRKIEAGVLTPPRNYVFDGTKRAMASRFGGSFSFVTRWLNIASGVDPRIPYILKGSQGRKGRQSVTYPAILINMA